MNVRLNAGSARTSPTFAEQIDAKTQEVQLRIEQGFDARAKQVAERVSGKVLEALDERASRGKYAFSPVQFRVFRPTDLNFTRKHGAPMFQDVVGKALNERLASRGISARISAAPIRNGYGRSKTAYVVYLDVKRADEDGDDHFSEK